jgi:HlyD family secretion protein
MNALSVPINAVTTRDKNNAPLPDPNKNAANTSNTDNGMATPASPTVAPGDLEEVVFLLKPDKTVKKIKVSSDIQDINYIEILTGLNEGDEVITGPYGTISKTLQDGTKVNVVSKEKLFETKN